MGEPDLRWKFTAILPGALLVAVACSQIYQTQFSELTPSKGGGFGMFAVTDIRSSRTWSIDCLTEDGLPCRALIPRGEGPLGRWLSDAFRTKPDASARARAADRVFRSSYVPTDYRDAIREASLGGAAALLPPGWEDTPLYRLPPLEQEARTVQPVKLKAIRFQAWRLRYDRATKRMFCEKIGEPEERGQW